MAEACYRKIQMEINNFYSLMALGKRVIVMEDD
jgi:hypothetical protein